MGKAGRPCSASGPAAHSGFWCIFRSGAAAMDAADGGRQHLFALVRGWTAVAVVVANVVRGLRHIGRHELCRPLFLHNVVMALCPPAVLGPFRASGPCPHLRS